MPVLNIKSYPAIEPVVGEIEAHSSHRTRVDTLALTQAGILLSRPQHQSSCPAPRLSMKNKAIEDTRNSLKPGEVFYDADECKVRWLPTLRAMWSPRGQHIIIPPPVPPYKRYGLGAVNDHTGETVALFRRRKRRQEIADCGRPWSTSIQRDLSLSRGITRIRILLMRSRPWSMPR
jgi:hypothetical protein